MKRHFACVITVVFLYNNLNAQENRLFIKNPYAQWPSDLLSLQTEVFGSYCALAGCHDGSFEPDFRTATSTYNTTVYHPVTKNNKKHSFAFRVVPNSPEQSVLCERLRNCCFVNNNDRMPFTVGDTLSDFQIRMIETWIKSGAQSISGTFAEPPKYLPELYQMIKVGNRPGNAIYNDTHYRLENQLNKTIQLPNNIDSIWISFEFVDNTSTANGFIFVYEEKSYDIVYKSYSCFKRGTEMMARVSISDFKHSKTYFLRATLVADNSQKIFFPVDSASNYERFKYSILRQ